MTLGGVFGDEINVPSSNCDGRWNPPILIKARIKNGVVYTLVSLESRSQEDNKVPSHGRLVLSSQRLREGGSGREKIAKLLQPAAFALLGEDNFD